MAANELSGDAVVVFPYKDHGKEGNVIIVEAVMCEDDDIVEAVPCEDDEGANKVIGDMDKEELTLEEYGKKVSTEKTVDELVEAVLCEYEEGTKKENVDMDVEALPLEGDDDKSNREKNI